MFVRFALCFWLFSFASFACAAADEAQTGDLHLDAKPSVWLLESAKGRIVLLGSIHVGQANFYPLAREVELAFEHAAALVVELDITKIDPIEAARVTRSLGFFSSEQLRSGKSLSSTLGDRANQQLTSFCQGNNKSACLEPGQMDVMRPWLLALHFANVMLSVSEFSPQFGVDKYFLEKAAGKPIIELESLAQQLGAFDSLSEGNQTEFLMQALQDFEQGTEMVTDMASAWRRGDDVLLEELVLAPLRNAPTGTELYDVLMVKRNVAMKTSLLTKVKPSQTLFVVVGAGHLLGDQGLVKLLQVEGFSAEKF